MTLQDRYDRGRQVLDAAYGTEATDQTIAFLDLISEDYSKYLVEACFADVYGRPVLGQGKRELINVIALTSVGGLEGQLERHIDAALEHGISREELTETIFHLALIVGHPRANAAFAVLKQVLDRRLAES